MLIATGKISLSIIILGFLFGVCSNQPASPNKKDSLENVLDSLVPSILLEKNVPGVSIAVLKGGEIIFTKGYGKADIQKNKAVNTNTLFNIGSISKSLTAFAIVALSEEGIIHLDSPVVKYIRRWKLPANKFDPRKVTIRKVLSHTAGLSVRGYNGQYLPGEKLPTIEESLAGYKGSDGKLEIISEPGTQFSYSSGGYTLLQLLIEEMTGNSFSIYMEQTLFEPLNMDQTGYALKEATATPYKGGGEPWPQYQFIEQGSGGIYTTANDLAKFVAAYAIQNKGKDIVKPESIAMILQPAPGTNGNYGLGCKIFPVSEKTKLITHDGANEGWRAMYMLQPDTGNGIVIMTNSDEGGKIGAPIICKVFSMIGVDMAPLCENGVPKQR